MGVYNMPPYLGIIRNVETDPDTNVDKDLLQWDSPDRLWKNKSLSLSGIVPDTRSISTTEGLQGGGDFTADRAHKLDINGLTEDTAPDGDVDFVAIYDVSGTLHKKSLIDTLIRAARLAVRTVTSNYTVVATDDIILADATSGSFTVTLPSVSGNKGRPIFIKRINSGVNLVSIQGGAV